MDYVIYERDQAILYVHVHRAIYGMMMLAMLFNHKLAKSLVGYGFRINPYNPCVANKLVNDKQFTISWHIDDLKISHMEPKTVDDFLVWLKQTYVQIGELKSSCGTQHDYLGMTLDFGVPGQVTIDMVDYVKSMVSFSPTTWKNPKCQLRGPITYSLSVKKVHCCLRTKRSYFTQW
jgi:hypothetical protein